MNKNFNKSFKNGSVAVKSLKNTSTYNKVMAWLAAAFVMAGVGAVFIGPLVPASSLNFLWLGALVALIAAGFLRNVPGLNALMTLAIPTILGILLYPTLNHYITTGSGNIVISAAAGTAIVFGVSAVAGWKAKENKVESKIPMMTGVLFALIGVSLINVFFLKLTAISFIISLIIVPLFTRNQQERY